MLISVIICTRDRIGPLQDCLDSLVGQSRRPDEVIIVDASDTQPVPAMLRYRYGDDSLPISYQYFRPPQLTAQRNAGIRASKGDVIFFLDDDVVLEPDYIEQILRVYEEDARGVVGGVQGTLTTENTHMSSKRRLLTRLFFLDGPGDGRLLPSGLQRWVDYCDPRHTSRDQPMAIEVMSGCIQSYRRCVFDEFRLNERILGYGGEDRDFSCRVSRKYRIYYIPWARAEHRSLTLTRLGLCNYYRQAAQSHIMSFLNTSASNPVNWLALVWSILGRTLFVAGVHQSSEPVYGLLRGYVDGILGLLRPQKKAHP